MDWKDYAGLGDHRYAARARARQRDTFERFDEKTMTLEVEAADGEPPVRFPARFAVCLTCEGRGSHVNPDIDGHGITADEFYEDPGFAEDYMRGTYDVPCYDCGGLRVVAVIDREAAEQSGLVDELAAYEQVRQDAERDYQEQLAERRMGC
jgi:hypothetical protein